MTPTVPDDALDDRLAIVGTSGSGKGEAFTDVAALAQALGKKPSGGHWNTGLALLRNNDLVEFDDGRRLRAHPQFRSPPARSRKRT